MLEWRPGTVEPRIYILDRYSPDFLERCRAVGVDVVPATDALGTSSTIEARFRWLRQRFQQDRIGACVWVSAPPMAAFALSMRLAPAQIFWALRFHPLSGPYIDGYITWGAPSERTRRYGNQEWEVVPMPLALDDSPAPQAEVERLRSRFPEPVLLGTLAREEKINSAPYLRAVADILVANPRAGFLWTGRSEHPGVAGFLREAGVAGRCHFVGWVDTKLHAAALDVFLETFPFGSGVTALQALGAGTPLLSYLHPETIFGTYWPELAGAEGTSVGQSAQPPLESPDRHEILCARDADEYITLANRLVSEPSWRKEVGARGRGFFLEEHGKSKTYAALFFETIERIASAKLARR